MALQTTLGDVVRQLQQNKKSTDDTASSVKSLVATIREQIQIDQLARAEQAKQDIENQRELINAMKGGGVKPTSTTPGDKPSQSLGMGDFGLAAIVATAGAIVGAVRGHLKAIQTVINVIGDISRALWAATKGIGTMVADTWRFIKDMKLLPEGLTRFVDTTLDVMKTAVGKVATSINTAFDFISARFWAVMNFVSGKAETAKGFLSGIFDNTVKWFDEAVAVVKGLFTISEESAIGKVVTNLKNALDTFMNPIKSATTWLMSFMNTADEGPGLVQKTLTFFGSKISVLGNLFKIVSSVVEKIFWPIGVIIATIDTIKGVIEGYAEGGFWGALEGGIDALFNTLIGEPLDLIKDITSWVLDKLGFTNASKWLDSFSFVEMFDTITDKLFGGISSVISFVADLFVNMKDLVVAVFDQEITRVVNGFKKAFETVSAFIANIPDQLYLMISKNLRFGMPQIEIPLPDWLQYLGAPEKFTLIRGFEVGVGDATTQAAAQERINLRNAERDQNISRLDEELVAKQLETAAAWQKLTDQFKSNTVVVQDNSASVSNQTNNGAMVRIDSSIPAHNVSWAMRTGRIPNYFAQ